MQVLRKIQTANPRRPVGITDSDGNGVALLAESPLSCPSSSSNSWCTGSSRSPRPGAFLIFCTRRSPSCQSVTKQRTFGSTTTTNDVSCTPQEDISRCLYNLAQVLKVSTHIYYSATISQPPIPICRFLRRPASTASPRYDVFSLNQHTRSPLS